MPPRLEKTLYNWRIQEMGGLVYLIPVVGLILMLVWGFSAGTPAAKKNWARANLIWSIIVFIVTMVFSILAALGEVSSMSYIGGLFH